MTLVGYSFVACIAFFVTKENDNVAYYFGIGIVGILLTGFFALLRRVIKSYKLATQKTIFKCPDGITRYCNFNKSIYIELYGGYTILKRYAPKSEWETMSEIPKDIIEAAQAAYNEDDSF